MMPNKCLHQGEHIVESKLTVFDDKEPYEYRLEIQVMCADCKKPFHFRLPVGFTESATMSAGGLELRVPIYPVDEFQAGGQRAMSECDPHDDTDYPDNPFACDRCNQSTYCNAWILEQQMSRK